MWRVCECVSLFCRHQPEKFLVKQWYAHMGKNRTRLHQRANKRGGYQIKHMADFFSQFFFLVGLFLSLSISIFLYTINRQQRIRFMFTIIGVNCLSHSIFNAENETQFNCLITLNLRFFLLIIYAYFLMSFRVCIRLVQLYILFLSYSSSFFPFIRKGKNIRRQIHKYMFKYFLKVWLSILKIKIVMMHRQNDARAHIYKLYQFK